MSESHVRKVIDSAAVLWSIRLRIWGSGVRISSGAPPMLLISRPIVSRSGFPLKRLSSGSYRLATLTCPNCSKPRLA
jgi:hypothetical protein